MTVERHAITRYMSVGLRCQVLVLLSLFAFASPSLADFTLSSYGPHAVTQGYATFLTFSSRPTSGDPQNYTVALSATGLPAGATATFPDILATCCGQDANGNYIAWRSNFDTGVKITTTSATPTGTYTILLNASGGGFFRQMTYTLAVETVAPPPTVTPTGTPPPIPNLATWKSNMINVGTTTCSTLSSNISSLGLAGTLGYVYYDMARVMYQIGDYDAANNLTGNPAQWDACAKNAVRVYRDGYVMPNNGGIPGFWNFTNGLLMDYQTTGDTLSQNAVTLVSQNAAFAADVTAKFHTVSATMSRETAYSILSYINAQAVGASLRARRMDMIDMAYGHMHQWFTSFYWRNADGSPATETLPGGTPQRVQMAPFMVALTAHSIIRDWEQTRDPRAIAMLKKAADWLWSNAFDSATNSMWYDLNENPRIPAPDLNLLIAPIYAFLYTQTGDAQYQYEGDLLFSGGVLGAWLGSGKHFDQNYWWSTDYVAWRTQGTGEVSPPPPPPPPPQPDTTLPTVSITQPVNGAIVAVGSKVAMTANAADNVGVTKVIFTVNGKSTCSDTTAPYSCTWSVPRQKNRTYQLQAAAYDAAGNVGKSSIITVTTSR
jgi:hypothetical protein